MHVNRLVICTCQSICTKTKYAYLSKIAFYFYNIFLLYLVFFIWIERRIFFYKSLPTIEIAQIYINKDKYALLNHFLRVIGDLAFKPFTRNTFSVPLGRKLIYTHLARQQTCNNVFFVYLSLLIINNAGYLYTYRISFGKNVKFVLDYLKLISCR